MYKFLYENLVKETDEKSKFNETLNHLKAEILKLQQEIQNNENAVELLQLFNSEKEETIKKASIEEWEREMMIKTRKRISYLLQNL